MYGKLFVLAAVALAVVVASPMEDMMFKRAATCCPALATAFKPEAADKCKKVPCKMQCLYESLTTTADNKTTVNLAAVNTALDTLTAWDATVLAAAKTSCTATAPVTKGKCASGVREVYSCVVKALVPTCPAPVEGKCGGLMKKPAKGAAKAPAAANATVTG